MSAENKTYFGVWSPQPRPEWVTRINQEGECMDIRGVVPLDENSLLDQARRNTGLSDFGKDDWYEPFQVFLKALEAESNLHLVGRLMAREEILNLLEARLQIENEFKRHPEIAEQQIVKPLVIIGQGRSGTTALHNLLAQDSRMGALMQWETMYPVPAPEKATCRSDPRIARADIETKRRIRVTPEAAGQHIWGGDVPQECVRLHALNFMSVAWLDLIGQSPSYAYYMMSRDMTPAYEYQKRVMQLLQWKNPRDHWVLKSPLHLDYFPQMLKVFPDACVTWIHRDPVKAFASVVSLIGTAQWQRSDTPFSSASYGFVTDLGMASARLERVIDWIEQGVVPRERILNVQYKDFVRDRLAMAARIYDYFNIDFPEVARRELADFIEQNPRDKRPSHSYGMGSEESLQKARAAFKRYQTYFDVPSEA